MMLQNRSNFDPDRLSDDDGDGDGDSDSNGVVADWERRRLPYAAANTCARAVVLLLDMSFSAAGGGARAAIIAECCPSWATRKRLRSGSAGLGVPTLPLI